MSSVLPTLDPLHILALHCPQCPFLTLSVSRLFEHCMEHSEPSDCTLLQCQQCGIVSTHQGILEEHIKAWHPNAPFVLKQISKTVLRCPGDAAGAKEHRCHFCNFHSVEHHKINIHYFQVHNITNVSLEKREFTVPRLRGTAPINLIKLPSTNSSNGNNTSQISSSTSATNTHSDSSPLLTAALVNSTVAKPSTCTFTLVQNSSTSSTGLTDSGISLPEILSGSGENSVDQLQQERNNEIDGSQMQVDDEGDDDECVLVLDDKTDEADLQDDNEENETVPANQNGSDNSLVVNDGSLIMKSVTDSQSSILTMSLTAKEPTSSSESNICFPEFKVVSNAPSNNGTLTSDRDKVPIEMLPVSSFGRRYEVLTRNLRQMGGDLLIGRRLDKGTLDFSCQCDYCGRIVKLSKPKAYKFKIHLRSCKEHRKHQIRDTVVQEPRLSPPTTNGGFTAGNISIISLPKSFVPLDSGSDIGNEQDSSVDADRSNSNPPSRTETPLSDDRVNILGLLRPKSESEDFKIAENAIKCS